MKNIKKSELDVELLDTTLRDGEQTPGVAFTPEEKLQLSKLLLTRLKVDRLEIGSARVSAGERESVAAIYEWAAHRGYLERLEMLGFVDGGKSAEWIAETGGKVINLLTKGSEAHCRIQLRKTPAQHYADVAREINIAAEKGMTVNVYLEDWSRGMGDSLAYVFNFVDELIKLPVARIMLPDTLGVLTPWQTARYLDWMYAQYPQLRLDFHGHNDYGLATANSLAAVNAGIDGVHCTLTGLGERTGNQSLEQLVVAIHDNTPRKTQVVERELVAASELVQALSGKRCSWNAPVIGSDVFTQTCGVHADGDKKGNLYANRLLPERFGRRRDYALGKLSGKASIDQNLQELGVELDAETRARVLQEVIRLGDRKKQLTPADLPYIIADILSTPIVSRVRILDYRLETRSGAAPKAWVKIEFDGEVSEASSTGDGGYDAFMKALRKLFRLRNVTLPKLLSYEVRIPPGGKTDALVEAKITWAIPAGGGTVTSGVDPDQIVAAIKATEKMLNMLLK